MKPPFVSREMIDAGVAAWVDWDARKSTATLVQAIYTAMYAVAFPDKPPVPLAVTAYQLGRLRIIAEGGPHPAKTVAPSARLALVNAGYATVTLTPGKHRGSLERFITITEKGRALL